MHGGAGLLGIVLTPMLADHRTFLGMPAAWVYVSIALGGLAIGLLLLRRASDLGPLARGDARWRYREPSKRWPLDPQGVGLVVALIGVVALAIFGLWLVVDPLEPDAPLAFPLRLRAIASVGLAGGLVAAAGLLREVVGVARFTGRTWGWWAVHIELAIATGASALAAVGILGILQTGGFEEPLALRGVGLLGMAGLGVLTGLVWMWRIYRSTALTAPPSWRYRDRA